MISVGEMRLTPQQIHLTGRTVDTCHFYDLTVIRVLRRVKALSCAPSLHFEIVIDFFSQSFSFIVLF